MAVTLSQTVAVDVFGSTGAFADSGSITVAPDATVLFGTGSVPGTSIDVDLAAPLISKGHAKIYASGKSLYCTAFLADQGGGQPYVGLNIVKKTKQKGD